ncbi:MAG TPA: hypothetical protein VGM60_23005 [Pseudonocardia sp.]|jgi:hypothetical protein|uniref:hypothetical protein n=1 Tax=Pseudonocardia sp. TaxID=60912 RepID=UPI002F3F00B5
MDNKTMLELRDHYDTQGTAPEMENGTWETEVQADPMGTTSLRLPKYLLDWVRAQAESEQVKPTALIRHWIEERRAIGNPPEDVTTRLKRLEDVVFAQRQQAD